MKNLDISDIQTPALLVDLDIMEGNLHSMAAFFDRKPCKLRPHFKNHKCVALAKKQLAAGAIGIAAATLQETETLVNAGIQSILIANEIAGEANLKKLAAMAAGTAIILAVDNLHVIHDIARLLAGRKTNLSLVVDIDLGLKRCGIQTGLEAVELVKVILEKKLKFDGLMGYEGHLQRLVPGDESRIIREGAMHQLLVIKNRLFNHQIPVNIVSTGGTGTYSIAGNTAGITEVQAGNYLLMDTSYAPYAPDFLPALSLLTTIISVTPGERFVINTGIKAISSERGMPSIKNMPGAVLKALHAEHGIVETTDPSLVVAAGMNIELPVYYSDGTVNLHRKMYGIRKGKLEEIFYIS